jgi:hypothetical protein
MISELLLAVEELLLVIASSDSRSCAAGRRFEILPFRVLREDSGSRRIADILDPGGMD